MAKKKSKKKKEKKYLGKHEFVFNFFSLVILIGIGVYFGYRSLYYYSKQNQKIEQEASTLSGMIIQNNPPTTGSNVGLHKDSSGYFYKGNVTNNYILFQNRIFRIIRINKDNTIKVISEDFVASFPFGESSDYQKSNVRNWLEKTENNYSGIYANTFVDLDKYFVKTTYHEDILNGNEVEDGKEEKKSMFSILTIKDYILAGGKSSYLNNGKMFFLLGKNKFNENIYVDDDGSIQKCDYLNGFGIRPVFTLKSNVSTLSGDGTKNNPYVINTGTTKNYIDTYVLLGGEKWRVYEDKNNVLRLYIYGYLLYNGVEYVRNYSDSNSVFDLTNKNNIAYFLNTTYLSNLPFKDYLLDNDFYIGEISDDVGYQYQNIYSNKVTCKVGLMNIFDYNSNNYFNDYFHLNTTSLVGGMQYNIYSNGLLEEADVREEKHIVPSISISKNSIKGGAGTFDNPYVLE